MTKGVSRHIIEVVGENPYFERAWFVVRPEFADRDEETLRHAAQRELSRADTYAAMRRRAVWRRFARIARTALAALAGAGIAILWMKTH